MSLLVAHRGRPNPETSENTIESLQNLADYVDGVEIDVRVTSDGVPVLMHDATVDRTTNGTGRVDSLSAEYMTGLDAGNGLVPTLVAYLAAVPTANIAVLVDVKDRSAAAVAAIVSVVEASPVTDHCVYMVPSDGVAAAIVRGLSATAAIGVFGVDAGNLSDVLAWNEGVGATLLMLPPHGYLDNREIVPVIRETGLFAGASTTNDVGSQWIARDDGVLVLLTDDTDRAGWWSDGLVEPPTVTDFQAGAFEIRGDGSWGAGDLVTGGDYSDCGVVFVAPSTGRVAVEFASRMGVSGVTRTVRVEPEIRTGAVIGAGTVVHSPGSHGTDYVGIVGSASAGSTTPATRAGSGFVLDVEPGQVYNARLLHRCSSGGAGSAGLQSRRVTVTGVA